MKVMKVFAPGKLILSGEHAVVYGHPAIAMAVNRYAVATATPDLSPHVSFHLSDLAYERKLSISALEQLKKRIKNNYQRFIHGDFKIRDVLHKPVELAQFAFSLFFETLNIKLTHGVRIRLESDIPMGCGMGSSAATILSIVHAVAHHMRLDLPQETFFELGLAAENAQHGFSSGLDLRVSLNGGCVYVKNGEIHTRAVPSAPMYMVNTGIPESSTGECVAAVAHHFKKNNIGNEFAAVTDAMDLALQNNQLAAVMDSIKENHKLLSTIGVVPAEVKKFISEIEHLNGAAKICGAGAISGKNAGIVLAVTENIDALEALCARHHYAILPITGEARGVHVV